MHIRLTLCYRAFILKSGRKAHINISALILCLRGHIAHMARNTMRPDFKMRKYQHKGMETIMKKTFRKLLCTAMAAIMCMSVMSGCGQKNAQSNENSEQQGQPDAVQQTEAYTKQDITVAALKGPTAIGMAQIMKNAKEGKAENNYTFRIAGTADEFTADLIKGDVQIAALPCNAAATLANKTNGKIQVMGINTLGVLYILDTGNSVQNIWDLKGRKIYATGKGTTPEYTLRYLLKSADIDPDVDVAIEFKSEPSEVAAIMASGDNEVIAMLPQPYVTTVVTQNTNTNVRIALDVTEEWEKLAGKDSTVVTGVVAVNAEFAKNNPQAVAKFMEEYRKSTDYVNSNIDGAAQIMEDEGIFKAAIAKKAIPYCNITFITGKEMKTKITGYLSVLNSQNPASIGGAMPNDNFYYITD